jgi:hypothetical protein
MSRERLSNGGAHRQSHHIKRHPAVNFHHAARYSERIGLSLNRFVTINLSLIGCSPKEASSTFRRMLAQRFAPWLRRDATNNEGISPTYVWTLESGGGQSACHWLVHVPLKMHRAFASKLGTWLESLTGARPVDGAIDLRPIHNLVGARRYALKGIDPAWAQHLAVRPVPQGLVFGKRSGFSRNLGPAARKRGGYRPRSIPPKGRKSASPSPGIPLRLGAV